MTPSTGDDKPLKKKRTWPILVGAIIGAIVVVFGLAAIFSDSPEDMAVEACERAVTSRVKSPSTAEFVGSTANEVSDGVYTVSGSVDAQNGFGAPVRARFVCREIGSPYTVADDVLIDE